MRSKVVRRRDRMEITTRMKRVTLAILSAVLAVGPTATLAQVARIPDRQVELPADADLVVAHRARQGRAVLVELVPAGETVGNFTRMVTLQTMPEMAREPASTVLDAFANRYRAGCPRSTAAALGPAGPANGLRLDCPLHPATGKAETVFARLLDMSPDLAMVQITMKFVPMPGDSAWARDYLARVAIR
jgi:hypothetical protein